MPAGFYLNRDENTAAGHVDEMWVPLQSQFDEMTRRTGSNFRVFARLRPGVSLTQARSEMAVLSNNLKTAYPKENAGTGVSLRPLVEFRGDRIRGPRETLMILFGAVTVVLLIAARMLRIFKSLSMRSANGKSRFALLSVQAVCELSNSC